MQDRLAEADLAVRRECVYCERSAINQSIGWEGLGTF
jgi:hypothetical protein